MTGAKMRVYEIAREVGLPNKDLITKIRALGLEVNNHMSSLGLEDVQRVKRSLEKDRLANTETKRLSSTVLRRRSKGGGKKKEDNGLRVTPQSPEKPTVSAKVPEVKKTPKPAPVQPPAASKIVAKPTPVKSVEKKPVPPPTPVVAKSPVSTEPPKSPSPPQRKRVIDIPVTIPHKKRSISSPKKQPSAPPPVQSTPPAQKETTPVPQGPRGQFEMELERARSRVAERDALKSKAVPAGEEQTKERDKDRPAVGSIISLPVPRIKITERAPSKQPPGQGQIRGRFAQQRDTRRRTREYGKRKQPVKRGGGKQTQITTPAEHKRIIRMEEMIAIPELAKGMGIKANDVLRKLWGMGMVGININASIDFETAQILAGEYGYEVQNVAFKEEEVFVSRADEAEELERRAPVVTVMGHVDHGKTSLLDAIRKTQVTKGEAGGITQHIAAYRVHAGGGFGDVVFLDTPGHEAFTEMRARGAKCTDIVVLVVAANDGVMPQTIEALNHAKDAGVSIIVAVNKCDLPDAKPERIKQQLGEHGLIPEEWGGDALYVEVSALKGEGLDKLLEAISLTAELHELKANPNKPAVGVVVEAKLDRNRGAMATILVQEGRLRIGDTVVAGDYMGKVRAMLDDTGRAVKAVGPSTPVELLGLDGVPLAGDTLNVAEDERQAKQVVEHRRQTKRKKELASSSKLSLENLMERIQEGEAQELKVVLKADVQGSAQAIKEALIKQSTDKVRVNVIQASVGGITESDVNLARAGGAIIIGFHVRPAGKSARLAEREGVEIKLYDVIYEALEDVRAAMTGLLAPIKKQRRTGSAEVRETFTIPKAGVVAGCMVTDGKVYRKSLLRVIRDAVQVYDGRVGSLKRFKEDVAEVAQGFECGLMVDGFNDIQLGDVIEAYEIIEEAATL